MAFIREAVAAWRDTNGGQVMVRRYKAGTISITSLIVLSSSTGLEGLKWKEGPQWEIHVKTGNF